MIADAYSATWYCDLEFSKEQAKKQFQLVWTLPKSADETYEMYYDAMQDMGGAQALRRLFVKNMAQECADALASYGPNGKTIVGLLTGSGKPKK